jgi:GNAT superfamily N-acetyltransferase
VSGVDVSAATVAALMADRDIDSLLAEYEAEAKSPELPVVQPQWEQYVALERGGLLDVIEAREAGRLIGFITVLRANLPHYGGPVCVVESVFVSPKRRRTGAGRALINEAKAVAAGFCTPLLITAPAGSPLETILPRIGCRHSNTVFVWRPPC